MRCAIASRSESRASYRRFSIRKSTRSSTPCSADRAGDGGGRVVSIRCWRPSASQLSCQDRLAAKIHHDRLNGCVEPSRPKTNNEAPDLDRAMRERVQVRIKSLLPVILSQEID